MAENNIQKMYVVEMPDGSKWGVQVGYIALNRAASYAEDFGEDFQEVLNETCTLFEDEYEIHDWASGNMDWSDVKDVAVQIVPPKTDYQEGWINGDYELR